MKKGIWALIIVIVVLVLVGIFFGAKIFSGAEDSVEDLNGAKSLSEAQCEEMGGTVYGDIGDGSVIRARCSDRDMEFLGYVPLGIEGSVRCR